MLRWIDGFEAIEAEEEFATTPLMRRQYFGNNLEGNIHPGRFGGVAFRCSFATLEMRAPYTFDSDTLIAGAALYLPPSPTNPRGGLHFFTLGGSTGSTEHIYLFVNADYGLETSGVLFLSSDDNVLTADSWHYVEMKVVCHETDGYLEVRVDGVPVIEHEGATLSSGKSPYDQVGFRGRSDFYSIGAQNLWDDWYVCDGEGGSHNDFLGPQRVVALSPNAAGDSTVWTPNTGDNWEQVASLPPDDDNYVESSSQGDLDLYQFENLPSDVSVVEGVRVCGEVPHLSSGGPIDLALPAKHGGVEEPGEAIEIIATSGTNRIVRSRVLMKTPDDLDWTPARVNVCQFGLERLT